MSRRQRKGLRKKETEHEATPLRAGEENKGEGLQQGGGDFWERTISRRSLVGRSPGQEQGSRSRSEGVHRAPPLSFCCEERRRKLEKGGGGQRSYGQGCTNRNYKERAREPHYKERVTDHDYKESESEPYASGIAYRRINIGLGREGRRTLEHKGALIGCQNDRRRAVGQYSEDSDISEVSRDQGPWPGSRRVSLLRVSHMASCHRLPRLPASLPSRIPSSSLSDREEELVYSYIASRDQREKEVEIYEHLPSRRWKKEEVNISKSMLVNLVTNR